MNHLTLVLYHLATVDDDHDINTDDKHLAHTQRGSEAAAVIIKLVLADNHHAQHAWVVSGDGLPELWPVGAGETSRTSMGVSAVIGVEQERVQGRGIRILGFKVTNTFADRHLSTIVTQNPR